MIIKGKNIIMRTVEIEDTEFIFEMRQNEAKTKYLSKISGDIKTQLEWIKRYKIREKENKEYYFVIESRNSEKLGLIRMYDFKVINQKRSFCWGSWIIKDGAPKTTAIESALQIYEFGFKKQNFEMSHFDVRKGNDKVIAFHKRFGAKIIGEDELNYYFYFFKEDYEKIRVKYKKFLY